MNGNNIYPSSIFDNNLKNCSSGACQTKQSSPTGKPKQPTKFEPRNFYPHSYTNPNEQQNQTYAQHNEPQPQYQQNYSQPQYNQQQYNQPQHNQPQFSNNPYPNYGAQAQQTPPNYSYSPQQPYDYNAYMQTNSYAMPNPQAQYDNGPQNYQQPKQKNMFGSLDPQQLMSMINSKGSFGNIMGLLGNSNPQLSMIMGLLQNSPKSKKLAKAKKVDEIVIDDEKDAPKSTTYKTVKDFYKEHQNDEPNEK